MVDWLMKLALSQADKIARATGKTPEQVKTAISQAKQMLPELKNNGTGALKRLGVSKDFINTMRGRFGHLAAMIPGVCDSDIDTLSQSLDSAGHPRQNAPNKKPCDGMDLSKYPRV